MLTRSEDLIRRVYLQSAPSACMDLGTTAIEFSAGGTTYRADAHVELRFAPFDRLLFSLTWDDITPVLDHLPSLLPQGPMLRLSLPDQHGAWFDAFPIHIGSSGAVFRPHSSVITLTPHRDDLTNATFHVFNLPDFHGPDDYLIVGSDSNDALDRCGRAILKANGWKVTVAGFKATGGLEQALRAHGGYVITHMGSVERIDGSTFSSEQLTQALYCVRLFLSLCLGRWTGVALPVAVNDKNDRVFEQWGIPQVAPNAWSGSGSWFDEHHGELLSQVFPGFYARWKDPLWTQALETALYWYVCANDRGYGVGVDAALILAQTALECLAWTYCVQERRMVSDSAFSRRGLSAADRIRMLASALEIPVDLPRNLAALTIPDGRAASDIPDAITSVRNTLVHPAKGNGFAEDTYYEAWRSAMWLLDLALLRLCGHGGRYANRLADGRWAGELSTVPWSKEGSK
jgi:hypothetical protein